MTAAPAIDIQDVWTRVARGRNLGKVVAVNFLNPQNGGNPGIQGSAEILRIEPRGDGTNDKSNALTVQGILTLAPPQLVANATFVTSQSQTSGGQDTISLTQGGELALGSYLGGQVGAPTPIGGGGGPYKAAIPNPIAIVQWGVGSVINRVECDILNGLCLNLTFSTLVVSAVVEPGFDTSTSTTYILGANVGPGFAKPSNSQRTIAVGGVGNAAQSAVFTIPRMAKDVRMAMTDGTGQLGLGVISFWQDSEGTFPVADYTFTGNNPLPIPIPLGAYFFTIRGGYIGAGTFPNPLYSAIFNLAV